MALSKTAKLLVQKALVASTKEELEVMKVDLAEESVEIGEVQAMLDEELAKK